MIELYSRLLLSSPNNEQNGYSACLQACYNGQVPVVKYLVEVAAVDWSTDKVLVPTISVFVWQNRRINFDFHFVRPRLASRPCKSLHGVTCQTWWHIWYEVHVTAVVVDPAAQACLFDEG